MAKIGAPTKYDPSWMLARVIDLMADGASKVEVAANLGINKDTLNEWCKVYPDFSVSIKKGEELCEAWWERNGRVNLQNDKFNAPLWYMNMKNRFRWADRQEQKVDLSANITVSDKIEKARSRLPKQGE